MMNNKVWTAIGCADRFFPLLRTIGAIGICLSAYAFDHAIGDFIRDSLYARHAEAYLDKIDEPAVWMQWLLDWCETLLCSLHDLNLCYKWATFWVLGHDPDGSFHEMFAIIAGMRKCMADIWKRLGFLLDTIFFEDRGNAYHEVLGTQLVEAIPITHGNFVCCLWRMLYDL